MNPALLIQLLGLDMEDLKAKVQLAEQACRAFIAMEAKVDQCLAKLVYLDEKLEALVDCADLPPLPYIEGELEEVESDD